VCQQGTGRICEQAYFCGLVLGSGDEIGPVRGPLDICDHSVLVRLDAVVVLSRLCVPLRDCAVFVPTYYPS